MRALTVRQPWAWAIIHGGKDVENRTRNIAGAYRGPVAIHAAVANARMDYRTYRQLVEAGAPSTDDLPHGAIIGVVDLVDVHEGHNTERDQFRAVRSCYQPGKPFGPCSPWAMPDHHHLVLENPRPLARPIPAKGRLGLWQPDAALETAIRDQIGETP